MHTDEYATPTPTTASPQSFGNGFNLIRAVEEYGPQRVESIRKELTQLADRITLLTKEMQTLERMIAVCKPSDRGMAYAMTEGHPDAYNAFTDNQQNARDHGATDWPTTGGVRIAAVQPTTSTEIHA